MNQTFLSVKGWLTKIEGETLQTLCKGRDVLEVGSYCGRSMVAIASTCKSLLCIDHFQGDDYTNEIDTVETRRRYFQAVDNYGQGKVSTMVADFKHALELLDPCDFQVLFYDACHSGPATQHFLAWTEPVWRMKEPPVICVHDYEQTYEHYRDAFDAVTAYAQLHTGDFPIRFDKLAVMCI